MLYVLKPIPGLAHRGCDFYTKLLVTRRQVHLPVLRDSIVLPVTLPLSYPVFILFGYL